MVEIVTGVFRICGQILGTSTSLTSLTTHKHQTISTEENASTEVPTKYRYYATFIPAINATRSSLYFTLSPARRRDLRHKKNKSARKFKLIHPSIRHEWTHVSLPLLLFPSPEVVHSFLFARPIVILHTPPAMSCPTQPTPPNYD